MNKNDSIFVAGHKGMLGSAICKLLKAEGFSNIIVVGRHELDLTIEQDVNLFFQKHKPAYVILAAAKVGGINANISFPVEFLLDNLKIQNNVISASKINNVKKFAFIGSSCIYPKKCPQPIKEEYLLTGELEPTNEGYALAKIAGLRLVQYYKRQYGFNGINIMPCNLYGPNDSFDLNHSHVLSALVKRFSDAADNNVEEITLWGTGSAKREFMHVDDAARAILFLLENYDSEEIINVGWGEDISIYELAKIIANKLSYNGKIFWDTSKPDGMLRKCMDIGKMKDLGFKPKIPLVDGIDEMINIYRKIKN